MLSWIVFGPASNGFVFDSKGFCWGKPSIFVGELEEIAAEGFGCGSFGWVKLFVDDADVAKRLEDCKGVDWVARGLGWVVFAPSKVPVEAGINDPVVGPNKDVGPPDVFPPKKLLVLPPWFTEGAGFEVFDAVELLLNKPKPVGDGALFDAVNPPGAFVPEFAPNKFVGPDVEGGPPGKDEFKTGGAENKLVFDGLFELFGFGSIVFTGAAVLLKCPPELIELENSPELDGGGAELVNNPVFNGADVWLENDPAFNGAGAELENNPGFDGADIWLENSPGFDGAGVELENSPVLGGADVEFVLNNEVLPEFDPPAENPPVIFGEFAKNPPVGIKLFPENPLGGFDTLFGNPPVGFEGFPENTPTWFDAFPENPTVGFDEFVENPPPNRDGPDVFDAVGNKLFEAGFCINPTPGLFGLGEGPKEGVAWLGFPENKLAWLNPPWGLDTPWINPEKPLWFAIIYIHYVNLKLFCFINC